MSGPGYQALGIGSVRPNVRVVNNIVYQAGGIRRSSQSNNLLTDPGFVNAAAGDFRLRFDSPAIGAGESLPEVAVDIEGTRRPQGSAYDIGAYEFGPVTVPVLSR
jgi:hypothetical protein